MFGFFKKQFTVNDFILEIKKYTIPMKIKMNVIGKFMIIAMNYIQGTLIYTTISNYSNVCLLWSQLNCVMD